RGPELVVRAPPLPNSGPGRDRLPHGPPATALPRISSCAMSAPTSSPHFVAVRNSFLAGYSTCDSRSKLGATSVHHALVPAGGGAVDVGKFNLEVAGLP